MANIPTRLSQPSRLVFPLDASQLESADKMFQELYEQINFLLTKVTALQQVTATSTVSGHTIMQGFPAGITVDEIDGLVGEIGHGLPGPVGPAGPSGSSTAMPLMVELEDAEGLSSIPGPVGPAGPTGATGPAGSGTGGGGAAMPLTFDGDPEDQELPLNFPPGTPIPVGALVSPFTTTGNIDDYDFGNARYIRANNATLATIRGLKAGYDGQVVTIVSIGAGQVDLSHQDAGDATAANRLICFVTVGVTSLAAGVGTATLEYDGTTARWRVVEHFQGSYIAQAYAAGDFTAATGTWTVDAGDVQALKFYVSGRKLDYTGVLAATSTSATPNFLTVKLPQGYTAAPDGTQNQTMGYLQYSDNGGTYTAGSAWIPNGTGVTGLRFYTAGFGSANWSTATNTTALYFFTSIEIA